MLRPKSLRNFVCHCCYCSAFQTSARHQEHLESFLKYRLLNPILRVPDSVGLEWGPRISISNTFVSDVEVAGLWELRLYRIPGSLYAFTTDRDCLGFLDKITFLCRLVDLSVNCGERLFFCSPLDAVPFSEGTMFLF